MITEITHVVKTVLAFEPGALRTTGTLNGSAVDRRDFESALLVVAAGVVTDGTHDPKIQHSHDDGSDSPASWADAASPDVDSFTQITSANDQRTFSYSYRGPRRHVRGVLVSAGTTTGGYIDGVWVLGHPRSSAVAGSA